MLVALLGILVVVGWALGNNVLKGQVPGLVSMKANTAIGFLLSGIALYMLNMPGRRARFTAQFFTGTVLLLASLSLAEYIFDADFYIDELLFKDDDPSFPGRMAVHTAVGFVLTSTGMLLFSFRRVYIQLAQLLCLFVFFPAFINFLGYIYNISSPTEIVGSLSRMGVHISLPFLFQAVGVLLLKPTQGFMLVITTHYTGGLLARRLFAYVFIMPIILSGLILLLYRFNYYSAEFSLVLFVGIYIMFFAFALWINFNKINLLDAQNIQVKKELQAVNNELAVSIQELNSSNQELIANNEELMSLNDQLKATNHALMQSNAQLAEARATIERLSQEALNLSEEKFRELTQSISDVFFALDTNLRCIYWNKACEKFIGINSEDAIGRSVYEIFPAVKDNKARTAYIRALRTKTPQVIQNWFLLHGEDTYFEISIYPSKLGLSVFAKDVTERSRYENELIKAKLAAEAANEAKSRFLANMSHEIRTPLNGILGLAQVIMAQSAEEETLEYARLIGVSGERLLNTINAVLDLSKIEAQKVDMQLKMLNLNEAIEETLNLLKPLANKKNLELSFDKPQDIMLVLLDEQLFQQILTNLINNAIKFTNQGGIHIFLSREEQPGRQYLAVHVADTGVGMTEEFIEKKLFQAFEQESKGWSRNYEGTGLGLSITKKYVELLGGTISVNSCKDHGTTFTLRFKI